jgi:hypothetical protein
VHQRRSRLPPRGSYSFPQIRARNDKTFAADDKRHGAFKTSANFAPKKAKKNSDKSAEPGELQRRGKERKALHPASASNRGNSHVYCEASFLCTHLRRGLCPVPAIATAGTSSKGGSTGSRFPNLTASPSGPRTGSRSPNLACLSIRTWGQIRITQTFRPFDEDLAPDSDFPNLTASRLGPWGWIQVPKHSGLSIMTSWPRAGSRFTKLLTSRSWPPAGSRFPNLLVSRSGPQVGSRMPNLPTSSQIEGPNPDFQTFRPLGRDLTP